MNLSIQPGLFQAILADFIPGTNYHLPHTHGPDNGHRATSSRRDHCLHFILYVIPGIIILDLIADHLGCYWIKPGPVPPWCEYFMASSHLWTNRAQCRWGHWESAARLCNYQTLISNFQNNYKSKHANTLHSALTTHLFPGQPPGWYNCGHDTACF